MSASVAQDIRPWQAVLDFWFLPAGDAGHLASREVWFRKDPAFDAEIRTRFERLIQQAVDGGLQDWEAEPRGALARIVLLDQFTRNIWRDTPQAFSGDAVALKAAQQAVDAGHDLAVSPVERAFFYLPFEHAEDLNLQDRSVALFTALTSADPNAALLLDYAHRHRDVIKQFDRFPHRNRILGRTNTPEEVVYLAQPGAGF
ncbi:DUF924 domain-containing protein [Pigmentiphaga aceris]|uniref:DUF924 domain-containing protein n=1 Tax=Pigmentiphaga aceris TaxID=1940612 RepID=A0A5C0ATG1_9BURK|nr:DUF924 family protein [Pigmentiphaga aceris]QEI04583.1 DUF924 domain-containing protein [Pigmentiphaga aceris]